MLEFATKIFFKINSLYCRGLAGKLHDKNCCISIKMGKKKQPSAIACPLPSQKKREGMSELHQLTVSRHAASNTTGNELSG
jgi:hypothetical protein